MNTTGYILPSRKYKKKATLFSISVIVFSVACVYMNFNPIGLITEFHFVRDLLGQMFMPNYKVLYENASTASSILQTLSMAFLGTLYGGLIAILLAFLAAVNTVPYRFVRVLAQAILTFLRVIPILVVVLTFVIAVGPGPFAGMLTLIIITIGTFGKLFTEIIENAESAPGEAIFSVGASRLQVIRYSIIPQILPTFIANLLYAFDVNIRAAIGLGIFGGGGIGFQLQMSKSMMHYKDVTALITIIVVLVVLVEKLSDFLRRKILGEGRLN